MEIVQNGKDAGKFGEFEDESPVAAQGSGCWYSEEELSLPDTSVSPPL